MSKLNQLLVNPRISRQAMTRGLVRILVLIALVGATIALVFHEPIANNFDKSDWEDPMFFSHDHGFTTVADAFQRSPYWRGLYRLKPSVFSAK
jgi:hypothetical protein